MPKITVIGAGEIGRNTVAALLRTFPKDQELEIVLLNRNISKAEAALMDVQLSNDDNFGIGSKKNVKSKIKVRVGLEASDMKDSDIVIFTAGTSASKTGASTRESSLPLVYPIITEYAEKIKHYAPNSSVYMITNPSDITTWIMQQATGFDPSRVLGFGCELDARRFAKALRAELEKIGISPLTINADVIGGHSASNMIIPQMSLLIDGELLPDFKKKYPDKVEKIDQAVKKADEQMRKEGFMMIESGIVPSFAPVISMAIAARAFLCDNQGISISCSQVLTRDRPYLGSLGMSQAAGRDVAITDYSCISVPVSIGKGEVTMKQDYPLTTTDIESVREVAKRHQIILGEFIARNLIDLSINHSHLESKIEIKDRVPQKSEPYFYSIPEEHKPFLLECLSGYLKLVQPDLKFRIADGGKSLLVQNDIENLKLLDKVTNQQKAQQKARL